MEKSVTDVIRPEIAALSAYAVPDADSYLKLDAMENPYLLPEALRTALGARLAQVALNRYPVPHYRALKAALADAFGVPPGFGLLLGNGSDELIAMLATATARPGATVLAPLPGFVMYALSAQFAGMNFVGVPLHADFSLDVPALRAAIEKHRPALLFLAYPNNPTGNLFAEADMETLIQAMAPHGLVIVDEAYQPFADASFMPRLGEWPHLLVLRTVSKIGLAGLRLGYLSGPQTLLDEFEKVRPPYNINVLSEAAALFALEHRDLFAGQAAQICAARTRLATALARLPGVQVFPSSANFLLLRCADGDAVFAGLKAHKILVKNVGTMHPLLRNCLRITVSSDEENARLLQALNALLAQSK